MAAFLPGTGGTLKSTTVEDAVVEIVFLVRALEQTLSDPSARKLSVMIDTVGETITFSGSLGFSSSLSSNGKPLLEATEYLP